MAVFNPEMNLWTIEGWTCSQEMHGGSFTIWASPKFLEVAREIEYDEEKIQERARLIIKKAGFEIYEYMKFLRFGEWGLMHFDVPGNACGLDFDYHGGDALRNGASFLPHNVDNARQQSALMAIWLMWAHFVEGEIWKKRRSE